MNKCYFDTLRDHWLKRLHDEELDSQFELYVPAILGSGERVDSADRHSAEKEISEFLNNDAKVLLLLGDSGSGKTFFCKWMVNHLYHQNHAWMPLFLHLPSIKITPDFLSHYLNTHCDSDEIEHMKKNQQIILFLDSFDEMKQKYQRTNLFQLGKLFEWRIKVVITCRTSAFVNFSHEDQYNVFQSDPNAISTTSPFALTKRYVQHFQPNEQIQDYIHAWRRHHRNNINADFDYLTEIKRVPNLIDMIENPFILQMAMYSLPKIVKKNSCRSKMEQYHLTRLELFDSFTTAWFERQRNKLLANQQISRDWSHSIIDDYRSYSFELAKLMWQQKLTAVKYIPKKQREQMKSNPPVLPKIGFLEKIVDFYCLDEACTNQWDAFFSPEGYFNNDRKKPLSLVRQGSLLCVTNKNMYAFIHVSLLEYFAARNVFESAMYKASIGLGKEINNQLVVNDFETIRHAVDLVSICAEFEKALWDTIEESKYEARVQLAAANAITILNAAKKSFAYMDLRRIRIRYANLENANLEGADLTDADLRDVNLSHAWLINAHMTGCCIDRVKIDYTIGIDLDDVIVDCIFSQDNKHYAAITEKHLYIFKSDSKLQISKYTTKFKKLERFFAIAFISNSTQIIIATNKNRYICYDYIGNKVVYDYSKYITDENRFTANSHVAISADGLVVLSLDMQKYNDISLIQIFDVTKKQFRTTQAWQENNFFNTASYAWALSADGSWAVSLHMSGAIRKWDCKTGICVANWRDNDVEHAQKFLTKAGVTISGNDRIALLIDQQNIVGRCALSGQILFTLEGHTTRVCAIKSSYNATFALSRDSDGCIKLWDCISKKEVSTWHNRKYSQALSLTAAGNIALVASESNIDFLECTSQDIILKRQFHINEVAVIAISNNQNWLLSGSNDNTIKKWNYLTGDCLATWTGHNARITAIVISRDATQAFSISKDKFLCIWDCASGQLISQRKLPCHGPFVTDSHQNWAYLGNASSLSRIDAWLGQHHENWNINVFDSGYDFLVNKFKWKTMKKRNGEKSNSIQYKIRSIAITSDGLRVFSGGKDRILRLWDCKIGKNAQFWSDSKIDKFYKLLISTDDRWLLSGHRFGQTAKWDCATGKCLVIWHDHKDDISAIALSPDNLWAISCDKAMQVIIRRTDNGNIYQRFDFGSVVTTVTWVNKDIDSLLIGMSDGSVSCWTFSSHNASLRLRWRTKSWPMHVKGCSLLGVHGLSEEQLDAFKLNHAIVQQSSKSSEDLKQPNGTVKKGILSQREEAIPYNPTKAFYSVFDSSIKLTPSDAVITLARRQSGDGDQHAFMILESIENNHYHARRIDFVLDTRHSANQMGSSQSIHFFGKGLIEVADKAYDDVKLLAEYCYFKVSKITSQQSLELLQNINEDMATLLSYAKPGDSDIYRIFRLKGAVEQHNCLSWCERHLEKIKVHLTAKTWVDKFGVDPKRKIGNSKVTDAFSNWTLL